jgi:hypothetical protein
MHWADIRTDVGCKQLVRMLWAHRLNCWFCVQRALQLHWLRKLAYHLHQLPP